MLKNILLLPLCLLHLGIIFGESVDIIVSDVKCNNNDDGEAHLDIKDVQGISIVRLMYAKNNKVVSSHNILNDTSFSISNLMANDYILQIISNGISEEFEVKISQPEELKANKITVEQYPDNTDECNGIITVNPSGGIQPYSYKWIEGDVSSDSAHLENLCEGIYTCKIQDANKCREVKATVYLINGFNHNANN